MGTFLHPPKVRLAVAHVPYVEKEDMPEEYRYLFEENEAGELNVFKAVGNNPAVLRSYMRWGTVLWEASGLTRQEVEVVILAAARKLDAPYEWHQHVPLARAFGIDDETILAIADGEEEALTDREAVLVEYTGAFLDRDVTENHHDLLAEQFDSETVAGLTMLASHYLATGYVIDALGVEPEGEFVGWHLENAE